MPCSSRVSRYPRWGYLDKFDVNPYLMRAVALTVGAYLAVLGAFVVWQRLAPHAPIAPVRDHPTLIRIDPLPPTIQIIKTSPAANPGPRVVVAEKLTIPVPVPDEYADLDPVAPTTTGSGDGTSTSIIGPMESACCDQPLDVGTPDPSAFVAVEVEPELVIMDRPVYPELAREAGVSGDVLVRVLIGVDGRVQEAFVVVSVPLLDEAALDAARTAVFKPALQSGQPVAVWMNMPISFLLHD